MKSYSTYIFDLDGTITDSMGVWLDIIRDLLRTFDVQPPDDRTLAHHTHDWQELTKVGLPESAVEVFREKAYIAGNARLPEAPLHSGALQMLESLKNNGKNIAIVSAMDKQIFVPAMHRHQLFTITDVAIAGDDIPQRKPHPAGILKALEDLGIPEKEQRHAVYIGDKDTDMQAAHNAGLDAILYYPVAHQLLYDLEELKKHKPEHILTDWKELISV